MSDHTRNNGLVQMEKLVDAWIAQSALLWRTVYSIPFVASAIFAAWYAMLKNDQSTLGSAILVIGIVVMIVQPATIHRMAQYLNALRAAIGNGLPRVPEATFGLAGYKIALATPILLIGLFVAMLFVSLN